MTSDDSIIDGDDGLPATKVGSWSKEKHHLLRSYVDICRATRKKYLGPAKPGATYIDLFCGSGLSLIRDTTEWIDGSPLVAWKASQKGGAEFSQILIADVDDKLRSACAARLKKLGAPVAELRGPALDAAREAIKLINSEGLHFAFLDPYNLGELNFSIIETLAGLKRIDMLIHVSAMDLQRNLDRYLSERSKVLDVFAPEWRDNVDQKSSLNQIRSQFLEYWRSEVAKLGTYTSEDVKLVTGGKNQKLYLLMLAAKHPLAHKFWEIVSNVDKQGKLL